MVCREPGLLGRLGKEDFFEKPFPFDPVDTAPFNGHNHKGQQLNIHTYQSRLRASQCVSRARFAHALEILGLL